MAGKGGRNNPPGGNPGGPRGGYFKPWMRRVLGKMYTDEMLKSDFKKITPAQRMEFTKSLDPPEVDKRVDPLDVARKIRSAMEEIESGIPDAPAKPKLKVKQSRK